MRITPKRIALGVAGALALVGYLWVASVRAVSGVRASKAASRAARRRPVARG